MDHVLNGIVLAVHDVVGYFAENIDGIQREA